MILSIFDYKKDQNLINRFLGKHSQKEILIIDAKTVQEFAEKPEKRKGLNYTLLGTVSEYIEDSEPLNKHMIRKRTLTTGEVRKLSRQIFQGVTAIHAKSHGNESLMHRDIKPGNILVDKKGNAMVFDLGFARFSDEEAKRLTKCGSPLYMAPELISQGVYNHAVDSYALRVTLLEMATGKAPFKKIPEIMEFHRSKKSLSEYKQKSLTRVHPDLLDLIGALTAFSADKRLSPKEALNHPFLKTT